MEVKKHSKDRTAVGIKLHLSVKKCDICKKTYKFSMD